MMRDEHGEVLASGAGKISYAASALHAEAIAAYRGVLYASHLRMTMITLEMDSTVLASALKANGIDRSAVGCLVRQI